MPKSGIGNQAKLRLFAETTSNLTRTDLREVQYQRQADPAIGPPKK